MQNTKLNYYSSRLLASLIYGFSYLPLSFLYIISRILAWLLHWVFGYRLNVVRENLKNSFPEKTQDELRKIERDFYHHFADVIMEIIKLKTMPFKELKRRCSCPPESVKLMDEYFKQGKNVMIVMGHTGNWEWAGASYHLSNRHQILTAYRPLKSKVFDLETLKMRERTGNILVPMKTLPREMFRARNKVVATALIADQTPSKNNAFWIRFLNQETPFFKGTEILSQKFNTPLFWAGVRRIKKGYYELTLELITENPKDFDQPGSLTNLFVSFLERDINNQPEAWLWSHRRWKHRRDDESLLFNIGM
jgi:Kdo2-lipid IVA lauroyltransferase/acyltransferase